MSNIALFLISSLNYIYPKSKDKVLFISSPDFTDNSFALFQYMVKNLNQKKQYIWLVDTMKNEELYLSMINNNISKKNVTQCTIQIVDKNTFAGILAYIQSKYIFFTHGFYTGISVPKSQIRINLWHGMPLKAIGYLNKYGQNKTIPKSSIVIATSELYKNIMAKVFRIDTQNILITGQPRCDLLFKHKNCLEKVGIIKEKYKKIIFWAPTYRYAKDHNIQDGKFNKSLPILKKDDLDTLNTYLDSIKSYIIIKLHPMDILNNYDFNSFTNIKILKDKDLLQKSCQLYSLLSEADILITDYSSIYIDFLLLNSPIIFAIDDFEEYTKTRDFVFKNTKQYMPGDIVSNVEELIISLNNILINENDLYMSQRQKIKEVFHLNENNFSKRIIDRLNF